MLCYVRRDANELTLATWLRSTGEKANLLQLANFAAMVEGRNGAYALLKAQLYLMAGETAYSERKCFTVRSGQTN